jgi:hypothetical protein
LRPGIDFHFWDFSFPSLLRTFVVRVLLPPVPRCGHWSSANDTLLEIMGGTYPPYQGALNIGSVLRRNRLLGQARIRVHGALRDALAESNLVANTVCGINVSSSTTRVTLRGNRFENVETPVLNEAAGQNP